MEQCMGQTPRHQVSVRVQLLHLMVLLPARHCLAIAGDSMRRRTAAPCGLASAFCFTRLQPVVR